MGGFWITLVLIFIIITAWETVAITNKRRPQQQGGAVRDFRHIAGPSSANIHSDWEVGLREATNQALLREGYQEPNLRDRLFEASLIGRQDAATPFGDIAVLARGQLYVADSGSFAFVQDPYQNDCDDCHNVRNRCIRSQCEVWKSHQNERLVALWTVKRLRHRDYNNIHRYELEYTISPIGAAISEGFVTRNGHFDYAIPGHVFVVKNGEGQPKKPHPTVIYNRKIPHRHFKPEVLIGVSPDGRKHILHSYPGFYTSFPVHPTYHQQGYSTNDPKEIQLYKELIESLAAKTSTTQKVENGPHRFSLNQYGGIPESNKVSSTKPSYNSFLPPQTPLVQLSTGQVVPLPEITFPVTNTPTHTQAKFPMTDYQPDKVTKPIVLSMIPTQPTDLSTQKIYPHTESAYPHTESAYPPTEPEVTQPIKMTIHYFTPVDEHVLTIGEMKEIKMAIQTTVTTTAEHKPSTERTTTLQKDDEADFLFPVVEKSTTPSKTTKKNDMPTSTAKTESDFLFSVEQVTATSKITKKYHSTITTTNGKPQLISSTRKISATTIEIDTPKATTLKTTTSEITTPKMTTAKDTDIMTITTKTPAATSKITKPKPTRTKITRPKTTTTEITTPKSTTTKTTTVKLITTKTTASQSTMTTTPKLVPDKISTTKPSISETGTPTTTKITTKKLRTKMTTPKLIVTEATTPKPTTTKITTAKTTTMLTTTQATTTEITTPKPSTVKITTPKSSTIEISSPTPATSKSTTLKLTTTEIPAQMPTVTYGTTVQEETASLDYNILSEVTPTKPMKAMTLEPGHETNDQLQSPVNDSNTTVPISTATPSTQETQESSRNEIKTTKVEETSESTLKTTIAPTMSPTEETIPRFTTKVTQSVTDVGRDSTESTTKTTERLTTLTDATTGSITMSLPTTTQYTETTKASETTGLPETTPEKQITTTINAIPTTTHEIIPTHTKPMTTTQLTSKTTPASVNDFLSGNGNGHGDINPIKANVDEDDIFGSIEAETKPTMATIRKITESEVAGELFGDQKRSAKRFKTDTTAAEGTKIIYGNFFEASTTPMPQTTEDKVVPTELHETTVDLRPLTSQSYATSISFEVNKKNRTNSVGNVEYDPAIMATISEVMKDDAGYTVYKAELPIETTSTVKVKVDSKKAFDEVALQLVNHARSINMISEMMKNAEAYTTQKADLPTETTMAAMAEGTSPETKKAFDDVALQLVNHVKSINYLNRNNKNRTSKYKRRRNYVPKSRKTNVKRKN